MITFHIRTRLPRLKSTNAYLDKHIRESKTLCGAPVTSFDVGFYDKATPWKMDAGKPFEPCDKCLKTRKSVK